MLLLLSLLFSFQGANLKISPAAKPQVKFSLLTFLFTRKYGGLERTRTSDLTLIRRAL